MNNNAKNNKKYKKYIGLLMLNNELITLISYSISKSKTIVRCYRLTTFCVELHSVFVVTRSIDIDVSKIPIQHVYILS